MSRPFDIARTPADLDRWLVAVRGALVAALLGLTFAAALKPGEAESGQAAAPQQLCWSGADLAEFERVASAWPGRLASVRAERLGEAG